MGVAELTRILDEAHVRYELVPHARTDSAVAEARALGIPPTGVAKTLIVKTPHGRVRAVVPATDRIDLGKLAGLHGEGRKEVHLVTEDELGREYPEFELGAVPPLGGQHADAVVVDRRVAERPSIVLEAGAHDESIRLAPDDLVRVAAAEVADICED